MKTFFHPDQLLHTPKTYFSRGAMRQPQEVPERAKRLLLAVKALGFDVQAPRDHGMDPLLAVHSPAYLNFLKTAHSNWTSTSPDWGDEVMSNIYVREPNSLRGILAEAARYLADGSCPVGSMTWRSSYWSAQSAVESAYAVLDGEHFAYALCRPPGHHARKEAAGGFCYLNSAAIAAEVLRKQFEKVLILDTDAHHGQGVQEIFYDRSDVMYISVHGDPTNFYPVVAGHADEEGVGIGVGYNVNLPVPHGSSEELFFKHVERALEAARDYAPDALVFSHGFDIYSEDPQTPVQVSSEGFAKLGQQIALLGLPTVIIQEGGYHIDTLDLNARKFFGGILSVS